MSKLANSSDGLAGVPEEIDTETKFSMFWMSCVVKVVPTELNSPPSNPSSPKASAASPTSSEAMPPSTALWSFDDRILADVVEGGFERRSKRIVGPGAALDEGAGELEAVLDGLRDVLEDGAHRRAGEDLRHEVVPAQDAADRRAEGVRDVLEGLVGELDAVDRARGFLSVRSVGDDLADARPIAVGGSGIVVAGLVRLDGVAVPVVLAVDMDDHAVLAQIEHVAGKALGVVGDIEKRRILGQEMR